MVELTQEYDIVSGSSAAQVAEMIDDLLAAGWVLHGPMQMIALNGAPFYAQAMVRTIPTDD